MATPLLVATPALSTTYNVGMAETFSWIPMEGAGRPLFARATYLANASDISVSLSAGDLNINLSDVENLITETNTLLNALTASSGGGGGSGLSDTKLDALTADVSTLKTLVSVLTSTSNRINGFVIPDYNRIANTYYGTSNNLSQVDYKYDSTVVASLSFTYVTPTSADGALLGEVIKIL